MGAIRKDPESERLARDNAQINPISIKPETLSHMVETCSWVHLPSCSPTRCPFPINSLILSACVSPRTNHFWELDKSPLSSSLWHIFAVLGTSTSWCPVSLHSSHIDLGADSPSLDIAFLRFFMLSKLSSSPSHFFWKYVFFKDCMHSDHLIPMEVHMCANGLISLNIFAFGSFLRDTLSLFKGINLMVVKLSLSQGLRYLEVEWRKNAETKSYWICNCVVYDTWIQFLTGDQGGLILSKTPHLYLSLNKNGDFQGTHPAITFIGSW